MTNMAGEVAVTKTSGLVLHRAWGYDLLVRLILLGGERAYREKTLDLAGVRAGESVLDVGCGTGTLAIAAKRHVGGRGRVHGVDASPEMIVRARLKAKRASTEVTFDNALVENLPFAAGTFDVAMCTTMLHHLPDKARRQCLHEVRRVLKAGGRFLAVDFGGPVRERRSWIAKFHRHGGIDLDRLTPLINDVGLQVVKSGPMEYRHGLMSDLYFVLATVRTCA